MQMRFTSVFQMLLGSKESSIHFQSATQARLNRIGINLFPKSKQYGGFFNY